MTAPARHVSMEPNVSTIPMAMSASAPQVSLVFRGPELEIACNLNAERGGQRSVSVLSLSEILLVCCEALSTPMRPRIACKYRKPFSCDSSEFTVDGSFGLPL